jgi:hypothetical protein
VGTPTNTDDGGQEFVSLIGPVLVEPTANSKKFKVTGAVFDFNTTDPDGGGSGHPSNHDTFEVSGGVMDFNTVEPISGATVTVKIEGDSNKVVGATDPAATTSNSSGVFGPVSGMFWYNAAGGATAKIMITASHPAYETATKEAELLEIEITPGVNGNPPKKHYKYNCGVALKKSVLGMPRVEEHD